MFDDPELAVRMVDDAHGRAGGVGDFVVLVVEIDGVIVVHTALEAQGKMEIEQRRGRDGAQAAEALERLIFPDLEGNLAGGAVDGPVLARDLHLQDGAGLRGSLGAGMGKQRDEAALEGSEAALDLAFGLGRGRDEVGHAEAAQGALELAFGITAVAA